MTPWKIALASLITYQPVLFKNLTIPMTNTYNPNIIARSLAMIRYYLNLTTFRQGNLNCSAGWKIFNPVWHGITKQEKCSSLELPRPFCASKWVATNYFRKITSNYFQNNHSKSNWSWWISKPHFRNTAFVPPRRAVQGAIFVRLNELGRVLK